MCVCVCLCIHVCIVVCYACMHVEAREQSWVSPPGATQCQYLWRWKEGIRSPKTRVKMIFTAMWMLGVKLRSSGRILNRWAISPAPCSAFRQGPSLGPGASQIELPPQLSLLTFNSSKPSLAKKNIWSYIYKMNYNLSIQIPLPPRLPIPTQMKGLCPHLCAFPSACPWTQTP